MKLNSKSNRSVWTKSHRKLYGSWFWSELFWLGMLANCCCFCWRLESRRLEVECQPAFCNFWPFHGLLIYCVILHRLVPYAHTFGQHLGDMRLSGRPPGGRSGNHGMRVEVDLLFIYRRYFYFTEKIRCSEKTFRSPVQKWYIKISRKKYKLILSTSAP